MRGLEMARLRVDSKRSSRVLKKSFGVEMNLSRTDGEHLSSWSNVS